MGLAATQARYLGLTARKTNVEFEGQQVNQQRTALANHSANLYNQLYALKVPTPPSVTDYYKTEYSYNIAGTSYTIDEYTKEDDGTYTIQVSYTDYKDVGSKSFVTGSLTRNAAGTYTVQTANSTENYFLDPAAATENEALDIAQGRKTPGLYVSYKDTENNMTYYFDTEWLEQQADDYQGTLNRYYISKELDTKTDTRKNCQLSFDKNGYIETVIDPSITETPVTCTATTEQDTDSYNKAMNDYTYDKAAYEKSIADINAQTEQIQAQDRSLELRLRQLDTEQQALMTEMDSLKSVLDKSIEKVFKVFA